MSETGLSPGVGAAGGAAELPAYPFARPAPLVSSDVTVPGLSRVSSIPGGPNQMSFLRLDDPEHNRLHRMIAVEFTMRRVVAMRPAVEREVDRLLDRVEEAGPPARCSPGSPPGTDRSGRLPATWRSTVVRSPGNGVIVSLAAANRDPPS